MYSLIPFILIILASIMLVYEIKKQVGMVQSESKQAKHKAMNRLVITLALLYIVFTLPGVYVFLNFLVYYAIKNCKNSNRLW